uniref:Uncharacterized protein n=1 Tax=Fagus sylvatica TaxID=28930 RepID=A0A2N9GVE1_FAGSY
MGAVIVGFWVWLDMVVDVTRWVYGSKLSSTLVISDG